MKNLKNNFGITYSSVAKDAFFHDLEKPVDLSWVKRAKKVFKGMENVAIKTDLF
ncbi:MAG: hypothetical protein LBD94_03660 [Rickettsiales bacterium]|jgi:hypothetical protein|nr:hypothetical protein [Rickettsiales bacterium]